MITEKIFVGNDGNGRQDVLKAFEQYAEAADLSSKNKVYLRLLAEEMLGMISTIGGTFNADCWLEGNESGYKIYLSAKMKMSLQKREELLKTSTTGKNKSYSGVMDRIKEEMEIYWLSLEEGAEDSVGVDYGVEKLLGSDEDNTPKTPKEWKLSEYKGDVARRSDSERIAAWDELEKSIVANIADDVSVGIRSNNVEMVITKSL